MRYHLMPAFFLGFGALAAIAGGAQQLPASEGAPRVGEKAPDFRLPDANGSPVSLHDLLTGQEGAEANWVLLVFYRGYW